MSEETIPQMRETIERLSKDKAGLTKQVTELSGNLRVRDAREAFRAEGYNPKHGDLFAANNPEGDITVEAVTSFANSFGLAQVSSSDTPKVVEDDTSTVEDGSEDLAALAGGGSRSGDGGAGAADTEKMTRKEWQSLYRTDPAAAKAAVASGRVSVSGEGFAPAGSSLVHGDNPYASKPE